MRKYGPEKIAAGIDSRGGKANIRGWTASSSLAAVELGKRLYEQGVRWCVFTDIERDGVSAGVNIPATVELARQTGLQVIASGGVSSTQDVEAAAKAGLPGIIIGRALYEGAFTLKAALEGTR
jgi:phosphoribosylformimino-5-aminoimidazole carboxamide ribotide isomerase